MIRRVLCGILIDKKRKIHPLHDGLKELIQKSKVTRNFRSMATSRKR